jgi:hypothetical protein
VFLNGRPIGSLPLVEQKVKPGTYVVLLSVAGTGNSMARVTIRSGETRLVRWGSALPKALP